MVGVHILEFGSLKKESLAREIPDHNRALARKVESKAADFTEEELQLLEKAYEAITRTNGERLWDKIKGTFFLLYAWYRFGFDYILDLTDAIYTLTAALTDLVERNSEDYQRLMGRLQKLASADGKEFTTEELNAIFQE